MNRADLVRLRRGVTQEDTVRLVTRLPAAAMAATGLALTMTAAVPAVARPVVAARPRAGHPAAAGGTRLWLARFGGSSVAADMVESPSGSAVFITGWSGRQGTFGPTDEGTTLAYNTTTGAQLWADRYFPGPRSHVQFTQLAVSPDGSRVFTVASESPEPGSVPSIVTLAYSS
jgi:hypothetical protein